MDARGPEGERKGGHLDWVAPEDDHEELLLRADVKESDSPTRDRLM